MRIFLCALLTAVVFAGCTESDAKAKATVIQRKHLPDNKLQLHYSFKADDKEITDSVVTTNKVINDDSLMVSFKQGEPAQHNLLIP